MLQLKKLINEEFNKYINNLITESQESKSQAKAKKLAMQYGMSNEEAEHFVRVDLRNSVSNLRHSNTAKFTLGCTRLFFEQELTDAKSIGIINDIVELIANKYIDKFDQNLNGLTFNELNNQFNEELENIEQQNKEDVDSKDYIKNNDYKIIPINSFKEAQKYNKYLYKPSPWCITYMENMWDEYTNNGLNQVYFCLKNGFENIKPNPNGNPMDEYGLSMISVIVGENGKLAYSTLRWNHANNASGDHDLSVQEISNILGVNFYETFANNVWENLTNKVENEIKDMHYFYDYFDNIISLNDDFSKVEYQKKYNILDNKNKKIVSRNLWFDYIKSYNDNVSIVKIDEKYNLLNFNGNIVSKEWFDLIFSGDKLLRVEIVDKGFNFIDENGKLLSNQWFEFALDFNEYNLSLVKVNDKWNMMDINGNLILNKWLDDISRPHDGLFLIYVKNIGYNFIDMKGELISKQWFEECYDFKNGIAIVYLNDKGNIINTNGDYLSSIWFDDIYEFKENFGLVELNKKFNFIDRNGNLLSDMWFDSASDFKYDFAVVSLKNKGYNYINKNGQILSPNLWFDSAFDFLYDSATIILNKEYKKINSNGEIS